MANKNFSVSAEVKYRRSRFVLDPSVKTSLNVGDLIPLKFTEVLPGDSMKGTVKYVIRSSSPFIKPIMDNVWLDVYHFFVPLRLLMTDYEKVFGNPDPSAWTGDTLIDFPVTASESTITLNSVGDYLGLPLGENVYSGISLLPFRAFALVYDKWFRDQNNVDEILVNKASTQGVNEVPNANAFAPNNYFGMCPKITKKKDYFVSSLPNVQKGSPVVLPNLIPVYTGELDVPQRSVGSNYSLRFREGYNSGLSQGGFLFGSGSKSPRQLVIGDLSSNANSGNNNSLRVIMNPPVYDEAPSVDYTTTTLQPSNLYADGNVISISDLRTAFQLQRMLELDARGGGRINEYYLAHFGVSGGDLRLQIPEFLGGGRIPINVSQVPQTAPTSGDSALADLGAFSWSNGVTRFNKGFTEHGYIMTVCAIRQDHTYQQGIDRVWTRKSREDFYDPLLAHISEQPVYKSQLYGYAPSVGADIKGDIFGYNEAWADYRYEPSKITGQMRSNATDSLDIWHLGDYYAQSPTLSKSFVEENTANIDRVLSVPSSSLNNFIIDCYFNIDAIRVMPVYSTPGLVDHSYIGG